MPARRVWVLAAVICAVAGVWCSVAALEPVVHHAAEARRVAAAQRVLTTHVPVRRAAAPAARGVPTGRPLAHLAIPRFGDDWAWTVVEGVDDAQLALGPGHYPSTPLPGAPGNTAIAAHRAGHGDPFLDFDQLRRGDRIVLSQGHARWTYRVTRRPRIIDASEVWVLDRYAPATVPTLTLTTCWPKYGSSRRMYVRSTLVPRESSSREPGAPSGDPPARPGHVLPPPPGAAGRLAGAIWP